MTDISDLIPAAGRGGGFGKSVLFYILVSFKQQNCFLNKI